MNQMTNISGSALELQGVRKSYAGIDAVRGVDLTLRKGEFLTFLGPSGSGKSTTLAMVAGLEDPSAGDIIMDGKPIGRLPPYRRNLGMVFQHYALFPHMTVAQNIAFSLEMRRVDAADIRRRVGASMEMVGLEGFADRYPAQLSGGQQQRVALARATVFEPPLLLMDEPLSALDRNMREQMQMEIKRIHRNLRVSVLYVTHDQEEALILSDRIAVFNKGLIDQIDTPQQIYDRPATAFVAGFVGESNFIEGRVERTQGEYCQLSSPYGPLHSYNTAQLRQGDRALLMVRPEQFRLASPEEQASGNVIAGRITEVIYLGRAQRFLIELGDGKVISVVQNRLEGKGLPYREGREVRVAWQSQLTNILPYQE